MKTNSQHSRARPFTRLAQEACPCDIVWWAVALWQVLVVTILDGTRNTGCGHQLYLTILARCLFLGLIAWPFFQMFEKKRPYWMTNGWGSLSPQGKQVRVLPPGSAVPTQACTEHSNCGAQGGQRCPGNAWQPWLWDSFISYRTDFTVLQ